MRNGLTIQLDNEIIKKTKKVLIADKDYDGHDISIMEAYGYASLAKETAPLYPLDEFSVYAMMTNINFNGFRLGAKYSMHDNCFRLIGQFKSVDDAKILLNVKKDYNSIRLRPYFNDETYGYSYEDYLEGFSKFEGLEIDSKTQILLQVLDAIKSKKVRSRSATPNFVARK